MDERELINEVLQLAIACQQGTAMPEEHARLERLLADDPRAITWYLRVIDDTLTLRDAAAAQVNASRCPPVSDTCVPSANGLLDRSWNRSLWFSARQRRTWIVAAIACSLLVGVALAFRSTPTSNTTIATLNGEFARIIEISNVRWAQGATKYDEWSAIKPGARLEFCSGWVSVFFSNGAELLIEGPADVRYDSSQKVFARRGKLAARIGPGAVGFRIETPHANVIDRGTEFGLSVDRDSHTSVVVYKGVVDMDVVGNASQPRRRLETGEALSVGSDGQLSRITTVASNEFLEPPQLRHDNSRQSRLIESVTDNVRSLETAKYYRVMRHGFHEDCQAYVDRLHQWNGIDKRGLPPFLVGADYVMTFNDDKIVNQLEISVTLSRPADLFVLLDDRVTPPEWLKHDFVKTKWKVGGDDGWDTGDIHVGIGPGQSVEQTFSVWHRAVRDASTVVLGTLTDVAPPTKINAARSMYGIVATPLRSSLED